MLLLRACLWAIEGPWGPTVPGPPEERGDVIGGRRGVFWAPRVPSRRPALRPFMGRLTAIGCSMAMWRSASDWSREKSLL